MELRSDHPGLVGEGLGVDLVREDLATSAPRASLLHVWALSFFAISIRVGDVFFPGSA